MPESRARFIEGLKPNTRLYVEERAWLHDQAIARRSFKFQELLQRNKLLGIKQKGGSASKKRVRSWESTKKALKEHQEASKGSKK